LIFDSNVLIELVETGGQGVFADNLAEIRHGHELFTNAVIFAELSSGFSQASDVLALFEVLKASFVPFRPEEAFRAGIAFAEYRRRGGSRMTILPDFLIGAQAATQGWPLVTRDRKGFASYFPEVEVIDPYKVTHD
jgi:predicted nucleic acid-binding protein